MSNAGSPAPATSGSPAHTPASPPTPVDPDEVARVENDAVDSVVPYMPIVLPLAGGVLMLLLASIAVFMA